MIKENEEKSIEDKVMQSIKESGFNNSIIFLVQSQPSSNDDGKIEANAFAACNGNLDVLHECLCKLLEKDDKMYGFFAEALETARLLRNKTNTNIN